MKNKDRFEKKCKCIGIGLLLNFVLFIPLAWSDGAEFLSTLSHARGSIKAGTLRIHSGVQVKETWDDNIFNTFSNEKEDYISTVTPAILLELGSRYKFELGYAMDITTYSNFTDEDSIAHTGKASLNLNFPSGLEIRVADRYVATKDPRPEERRLRASHWSNYTISSIGYKFPAQRLSLEISYSQGLLKYDQEANKSVNRRDDTVGAKCYYRFLPKSSVLLEYKYGLTEYLDAADDSTSADSRIQAVSTGLKWDATAKLAGTLKAGWKWKDYKNAFDPGGSEYGDKDLWTLSGILELKASNSTRLGLNLRRSIEETVYSGNAGAGYSASSYYIKTGGSIDIRQSFLYRFVLNAGIGYEKYEFNRLEAGKVAREDEVFNSNIGLRVNFMKWLSTSLAYSYSDTNSRDDSRDERHNRVFLTLSAAL